MRKSAKACLILTLAITSFVLQLLVAQAAIQFNVPAFSTTWQRVDKPVADLPNIGRGYTWGPAINQAASVKTETYDTRIRQVQYFDKARMEINNPVGDPTSLYYVTTGLLVKELVSGQRQDGDFVFTPLPASITPVAGDPNDSGQNSEAPTYASFKNVATLNTTENRQNAKPGTVITSAINKNGQVSTITPPENRQLSVYDSVTRHNVADVFYDFQQQQGLIWNGTAFENSPVFFNNPTYVLGRPITEPYWTTAKVGGQSKDVLVQLFERRVLTYTPSNPPSFRVEMGNVGQHYFYWRYIQNGAGPAPTQIFPNDFSQLRAAYNKSGPIPVGGTANLKVISTGKPTGNIFNTPVVDTERKIAVFAAAENGIIGLNLNDDPSKIGVAWKYQTDTPSPDYPFGYGGSPLLYNGIVYIGVGTKLYAINSNDGTLKWVKQLSNDVPLVGAPITDGQNLYLNDTSHTLYAVNLNDGNIAWQQLLIAENYNSVYFTSGPVFGFDNNIYLAATSGNVVAYTRQGDPVNGWTPVDVSGGIYAAPAFANGTLYVATTAFSGEGGKVVALNKNGQITGQITLEYSIYNTPAVVDNRVYVAVRNIYYNEGAKIIGVSSNLTRIVYTYEVSSKVDASLAVVDDYLYFGAEDGSFYQVSALDPTKSKVLFKANRLFNLNSAVVANGLVYVSNGDGNLYIVK